MYKNESVKQHTPELYSAISLVFNDDVDINAIIAELNQLGIDDIVARTPRVKPNQVLTFAVIYYEKNWSLNNILNKMFSQIEDNLIALRSKIDQYHGECYIDIAFTHEDIYPELFFSNDILKKINMLNANISIDPY